MAPHAFAVVLTLLAAAAVVQDDFPKTPAEAVAAREKTEAAAAAAEKESTRRTLGALDEARVLRALAETYGEIEKLLKAKDDLAREAAGLPERLTAARTALANATKMTRPAGGVTDAQLAESQGAIETARSVLYETEMQLSDAERLAAGGAFRDRERVRADADAVDRARRALATGSSALGPRAMDYENKRIELRTRLNREWLNYHDQRESGAPALIQVLRAERDARKRELALRGQYYDSVYADYCNQLNGELLQARETASATRARATAAAKDTKKWLAELDELSVKTADALAAAAADRATAARSAIDRSLAGQLAEERARLQSLKSQLESDASGAGNDETWHAIEELLKSKEIQDLSDEISELKKASSKARAAAVEARRQLKSLEAGAADTERRALEEIDVAIPRGGATAAEREAFIVNFNKQLAETQDAVQARARAASHLADAANARLLTIQRLLDTLAEEEQIVRARGLFVRVGSQIDALSIRSAIVDFVNFARDTPRLMREWIDREREFLTNRENLPGILQGAGILAGSLLLLLAIRRIVVKISAGMPAGENFSIVERAKRLAVGLLRRMAITGFFVISALVLVRFLGGSPAITRAVDASAFVVLFVRLALALASALLRPDDSRLRLIPVTDRTARYTWRIALLASMSVFAVAVPRNVLDAIGYAERNPGFRELLLHVEQGLVTAAVVLLLAKRAVLEDLLPPARNHAYAVVREVILRLRTPFLLFAIALFGARLAGYEFLARYLESIALGGASILIICSLARGAVIELWHEFILKKLKFGPEGSAIAKERREFLDRMVSTLATVSFSVAAYVAFVAILRIGASELRAVDVGLVGGRRFNVSDLLYFALAIAATVVLARWTRRGFELFILAKTRIDTGTRYAIAVTSSYLVIVFGFVASLGVIGFQLQDFAIVLGAAGFGVGLGMQETAGNFICGLMLLFNRPVRVGDEIESEGRVGTIVDITITTTRVVTGENYEILIPNREIVGRRLVNHTGRDPRVRAAVRVEVRYNAPIDRVRAILLEAAKKNPLVQASPEPQVVLVEYGPSSICFELRVWCDVQLRFEVESQLRFTILPALAAANIEIPLPLQMIEVKGPVEITSHRETNSD